MGIDNKSVPRYVNIVIDDNAKHLKVLREQANADGQNDDDVLGSKKMSITNNKAVLTTEELYFDGDVCSLEYTGMLDNSHGETFIGISIPISDIILIDILGHAIKKLNKLKVAMESLK